jgi:DNA polymerase III delta subunit
MARHKAHDRPLAEADRTLDSSTMGKKPSAASESTRPLDATCRVVVLHGNEVFLRTLHTQQLREALTKEFGEVDSVNFDGATTPAADVLDECRSFGLIASHKMVIVDNADQLVKEDNRPLFERYAESPSEGTTLVLRSNTWRPGKLDKIIDKVGQIRVCEEVTIGEAISWCMARAKKRYACTIERDAAALLVERAGAALGRLDSELAKLAAATEGGKGQITRDLIGQFVGLSREEEVWSLQSVLLGGDAQANVKAVREAIDVAKHPAQLILWAMTDLAKKVHGCSAGLASGANPFSLGKVYRLWGPSAERVMSAAKHVKPARARMLLEKCVETDFRLKSGLGEEDLALERLAIEFARATV